MNEEFKIDDRIQIEIIFNTPTPIISRGPYKFNPSIEGRTIYQGRTGKLTEICLIERWIVTTADGCRWKWPFEWIRKIPTEQSNEGSLKKAAVGVDSLPPIKKTFEIRITFAINAMSEISSSRLPSLKQERAIRDGISDLMQLMRILNDHDMLLEGKCPLPK